MKIFVGSDNPVKVNAVIQAASETWPEVQVKGFKVPSGIPDQPIGDEQTKLGAANRSQRCLDKGLLNLEASEDSSQAHLGVGLEGGVFEYQGEIWSTVWVCVTDQNGFQTFANGARFKVPDVIADRIKTGGEMGPIVEKLVGVEDARRKQGMIGIITQNFVDRTEEYTGITKMALGLWYGRSWLETTLAGE